MKKLPTHVLSLGCWSSGRARKTSGSKNTEWGLDTRWGVREITLSKTRIAVADYLPARGQLKFCNTLCDWAASLIPRAKGKTLAPQDFWHQWCHQWHFYILFLFWELTLWKTCGFWIQWLSLEVFSRDDLKSSHGYDYFDISPSDSAYELLAHIGELFLTPLALLKLMGLLVWVTPHQHE